jgi:hypothetical protein
MSNLKFDSADVDDFNRKQMVITIIGIIVALICIVPVMNEMLRALNVHVRHENFTVNAVVVEKHYAPSKIIPIPVRGALIPLKISEKYAVTFEYNGYKQTFNNETLYFNVQNGDVIEMRLIVEFNENNEIVSRELDLFDETVNE